MLKRLHIAGLIALMVLTAFVADVGNATGRKPTGGRVNSTTLGDGILFDYTLAATTDTVYCIWGGEPAHSPADSYNLSFLLMDSCNFDVRYRVSTDGLNWSTAATIGTDSTSWFKSATGGAGYGQGGWFKNYNTNLNATTLGVSTIVGPWPYMEIVAQPHVGGTPVASGVVGTRFKLYVWPVSRK